MWFQNLRIFIILKNRTEGNKNGGNDLYIEYFLIIFLYKIYNNKLENKRISFSTI